ncbi:F-box protein [Legionella sp. 227]|uniref:F-box protein n=1 Tax=Legionella sp. 227 TaxID=3367288 RepID=UPI00370D50C4
MLAKSEKPIPTETTTHTPARLQDLVLTKIARDYPGLSLRIIHDECLKIPSFKEFLNNNSAFIKLLPKELKLTIIELLSINDRKSLMKVSKEWRQLVAYAANPHLDALTGKLEPILTFDFVPVMEQLLFRVEAYFESNQKRATQVEQLRQLKKDMSFLTKSLAKFIHCQKTINKIIQEVLEPESRSGVSFFSKLNMPRNNELLEILHFYSPECLKFAKQSWFKEVMIYGELAPEHPVSKLFADAFSEIKNLQRIPVKLDPGLKFKGGLKLSQHTLSTLFPTSRAEIESELSIPTVSLSIAPFRFSK